MQYFFLNGLWRFLKNGHIPIKLHSSAPRVQKKARKPKIVIVDDDYRQVPPPGTYKPIPAPRTNKTKEKHEPKPHNDAKQMVKAYEDLILPPPPQFRDAYKPVPVQEPVPAPKTNKPTPKINKLDQALKGHVALFEVGIEDSEDPLSHFFWKR